MKYHRVGYISSANALADKTLTGLTSGVNPNMGYKTYPY
jgi:hypothetical protein